MHILMFRFTIIKKDMITMFCTGNMTNVFLLVSSGIGFS